MTPTQKTIDRVRKLLALGASANEHEAASAAAEAARIMMEAGLSSADLDEEIDEEIGQYGVLTHGSRTVAWKTFLLGGIADAFGCESFTRTRWESGARVVRSILVGTAGDVESVRYLYLYLSKEIDRLADRDAPPRRSRAWKNSFRHGAVQVVTERLKRERQTFKADLAERPESTALVRVNAAEEAIAAYLKREVPNLRTRTLGSHSSHGGYAAGRKAGESIRTGASAGNLKAPAAQLGGRR